MGETSDAAGETALGDDGAFDVGLYEAFTLDDLPNIEWMPITTFHKYLQGISMRTLRRWAENGDIPASKRGTGRWSVHLAALRELRVALYRQARAAEAAETGILMFDDESVRFK